MAAPEFDPSKPFEVVKSSPARPGPSAADAFARGGAQGATLGLGDEFEGGVQAGMQFLATHPMFQRLLTGQMLQKNKDLAIQPNTDAAGVAPEAEGDIYRSARDAARGRNDAAQAAHPGAYLGGNLAGAVLTAPLMPGGAAKTLGQAVKTGAALGAAQGLGGSDADLTRGDLGGAARDTLVGAGVGGLAGGAAHGIAKGLEALPGALKSAAAQRAVKAAGGIQKDLNKMGEGEAEALGNTLLDSGAVKFGSSKSSILRAAEEQRMNQGARIGATLGEADQRADFDLQTLVDKARKEVLAPISKDPALATEAGDLERLLDGYELLAKSKGLSFEEANQLKSNLYKKVNKFADTPIAKEYRKQLSGMMKGELERQVDVVNPGQGADLADANGLYGQFKTAAKLAKQGADREAGNHLFGLGPHLAGATLGGIAGAADPHGNRGTNSALGAAAGFAGSKLLQTRGAAMAAPLMRGAGEVLEGLGQKLSGDFVQKMAESQPGMFGRWAGTITRALQGGPDEVAATHMVLSQTDPDYQEHMRQLAANSESADGLDL